MLPHENLFCEAINTLSKTIQKCLFNFLSQPSLVSKIELPCPNKFPKVQTSRLNVTWSLINFIL